MFFELMAALAAAFACGGITLLMRRIVPALPGWLVPVAAAAGLFGMTLYNEYEWAARSMANLPEGMRVIDTAAQSTPLKPWTYIWPQTTRFLVLDEGTARRREAQVMADHYIFARWQAPQKLTAVYDCANAQRADITANTAMAEDGTLQNAQWRALEADNPVLARLCPAGAEEG